MVNKKSKELLELSASKLGDFERCHKYCFLKRHFKGHGIETKRPKWYFTYGELIHYLMETVVFNPKTYKYAILEKKSLVETELDKYYNRLKASPDHVYDETHWTTEYYKVLANLVAFIELNNHWIIKLKKVEPELGLRAKFRDKYMYNGYLDLVATDEKDNIWIFDWKTPSRLDSSYIDYVQSNAQLRLYFSVLSKNRNYGKKVKGIYMVAMKKTAKRIKQNQTPEEYYKEILVDYLSGKDFYVDKIRLGNTEIQQLFDEMEAKADHYTHCLEVFGKTKNEAVFYKNSNACDVYGRCDYYPICWEDGYEKNKRIYRVKKDA